MPRRDRRDRRADYMRDRRDRQMQKDQRRRDYGYDMDYAYDYARGRDRNEYYEDQRASRGGDYAIRGIGRPREYNKRDRDYRDYADEDYEEEYKEDLEEWTKKLKKYDRFNMPKEQLFAIAKQMGINFNEYDEEELYAIYLMQVSDYPSISNEPRVYLEMAKSWLEDKDLKIDPSEKVCKYLYEIVMADED